jgi:5-methylcytosine-specific restriction endonuclease McrA
VAKRVARTRNAGTMTESQFWGMIRSSLRQKSRWWKPIAKAKEKARRAAKKGKLKWEYQCNSCKGWFASKEVEVDHIIEAGSLRSYDDLAGFVERLFAEDLDSYQVLCKTCHKEKTHKK